MEKREKEKSTTKPSDFMHRFPLASKHHKAEYEMEGKWIMKALAHHGNVWRKLSWVEYCEYYDFHPIHEVSIQKKAYFDAVVPYTVSAEAAASYSKAWKHVADWGYCSWNLAFHWQKDWTLHYSKLWDEQATYTLIRHEKAEPIILDPNDPNTISLSEVAELECVYKDINGYGITFMFEHVNKNKWNLGVILLIVFVTLALYSMILLGAILYNF